MEVFINKANGYEAYQLTDILFCRTCGAILRSVNQDTAKSEIIDNLKPTQVLLIMDWAMKFIPTKFRFLETPGKSEGVGRYFSAPPTNYIIDGF